MLLFFREKRGPLLFFGMLLLLSHILLPKLNLENWGPFYVWQLFSGIQRNPFYDLQLRHEGLEFSLSDKTELYANKKRSKRHLWKYAQIFGGHADSRAKTISQIQDLLLEDKVELVKVCKITSPLAPYMLMTSEEKRDNCVEII
jgi:hypothetical protein